jgi:hypothetical protein
MTDEVRRGESGPRDPMQSSTAPRALADLLNRVLDRGVVLGGDVTLSVAGVDLVFLRLSTLLTSVATAREKIAGVPAARRPVSSGEFGVAGTLPSLAKAVEQVELREPSPPSVARALVEPPRAPEPVPGRHLSESDALDDLPDAVASEIVRVAEGFPRRVEIDPEAVQRDLARLVLTIVELLRRVVEHQAVRRMDDPTLTEHDIERMGIALDRLDQQMREMKALFGLADSELNIDLGDLGTLL